MDPRPVKPSFPKLLTFYKQRKAFSNYPEDSADYQFWKARGWLDPATDYYYKVTTGSIRRRFAKVLARERSIL